MPSSATSTFPPAASPTPSPSAALPGRSSSELPKDASEPSDPTQYSSRSSPSSPVLPVELQLHVLHFILLDARELLRGSSGPRIVGLHDINITGEHVLNVVLALGKPAAIELARQRVWRIVAGTELDTFLDQVDWRLQDVSPLETVRQEWHARAQLRFGEDDRSPGRALSLCGKGGPGAEGTDGSREGGGNRDDMGDDSDYDDVDDSYETDSNNGASSPPPPPSPPFLSFDLVRRLSLGPGRSVVQHPRQNPYVPFFRLARLVAILEATVAQAPVRLVELRIEWLGPRVATAAPTLVCRLFDLVETFHYLTTLVLGVRDPEAPNHLAATTLLDLLPLPPSLIRLVVAADWIAPAASEEEYSRHKDAATMRLERNGGSETRSLAHLQLVVGGVTKDRNFGSGLDTVRDAVTVLVSRSRSVTFDALNITDSDVLLPSTSWDPLPLLAMLEPSPPPLLVVTVPDYIDLTSDPSTSAGPNPSIEAHAQFERILVQELDPDSLDDVDSHSGRNEEMHKIFLVQFCLQTQASGAAAYLAALDERTDVVLHLYPSCATSLRNEGEQRLLHNVYEGIKPEVQIHGG